MWRGRGASWASGGTVGGADDSPAAVLRDRSDEDEARRSWNSFSRGGAGRAALTLWVSNIRVQGGEGSSFQMNFFRLRARGARGGG